MSETIVLKKILKELSRSADNVCAEEIEQMTDKICAADRVFVAGAGRSGFVARAFSNRLMHLGITVYFVGESTTPAIREKDVLIILSGSGETESMKAMAKKAKKTGAAVGTLTIHPQGTIGRMADGIIKIPGVTPKSALEDTFQSIQPMGNVFEQMCWLICDSMIIILMKKIGKTEKEMFVLHANLE